MGVQAHLPALRKWSQGLPKCKAISGYTGSPSSAMIPRLKWYPDSKNVVLDIHNFNLLKLYHKELVNRKKSHNKINPTLNLRTLYKINISPYAICYSYIFFSFLVLKIYFKGVTGIYKHTWQVLTDIYTLEIIPCYKLVNIRITPKISSYGLSCLTCPLGPTCRRHLIHFYRTRLLLFKAPSYTHLYCLSSRAGFFHSE